MEVSSSGGAGGVEGGDGCGVSAAVSGPGRVKRSWTPEEDELLRRAVARHGPRKWTVISADIPGRSGKSCRLRWHNYLSPGLERRAFTPEEDAVIVAAHAKYGNKWATIARMLHGRTDNSIKNHWNYTLLRQRRAAAASANAAGCALHLRPATTAPVPPRHLLDLNKSTAAADMDGTGEGEGEDTDETGEDEDMDETGEDEGDDGSSEESPPAPLTLTLSLSAGVHGTLASPTLASQSKLASAATLASQSNLASAATLASQSTLASAATIASPAAILEQDPWLVPVMRQMISEEVHRQMQEMRQVTAPAGRSSAGAADGSAANGQD